MVPISIVIAGLFIAGAIYMSNNGGSYLPKEGEHVPEVSYMDIAEDVDGVDKKELAECIESGRHIEAVEADMANAAETGGRGTPWSIVLAPDGRKFPINGALPYESVKQLVDLILAESPELGTEATPEILENIRPVTEADHIRGDINASVKIVEYSDYDCPFCKRFHETMKQIMAEYGEDGDVAWVYRHFPLEMLHPQAKDKSIAAKCIAEIAGEDAFWEYSDALEV